MPSPPPAQRHRRLASAALEQASDVRVTVVEALQRRKTALGKAIWTQHWRWTGVVCEALWKVGEAPVPDVLKLVAFRLALPVFAFGQLAFERLHPRAERRELCLRLAKLAEKVGNCAVDKGLIADLAERLEAVDQKLEALKSRVNVGRHEVPL